MLLSLDQGKTLVCYAREVIDAHVQQQQIPQPPSASYLHKPRGVFVTIHTYPDHQLRGCIGIPEPVMPLGDAIKDAAVSATRDPRFPVLQKEELDTVVVEVTVLTPPKLLQVKDPREYLKRVQVGRDGLIIKHGVSSGLLLPQVPVEQGWDVEEFLVQTCWKAWLPPDAWLDPQTKIYTFSGQIFMETEPHGVVKEKPLV